MELNLKKELLKSLEITRQSVKNSMEVAMESYTEVQSRLDLLTYLVTSNLED